MTGWLIVNGFLNMEKFNELYDMFNKSAQRFHIDLKLIRNDEILVSINGEEDELLGELDLMPDFVLFWDKDVKLARYLEKQNIPVFNSARSIALCDDKSLTHLELMGSGFKMPKTVFPPMTFSNVGYSNYKFLEKVVLDLEFPFIIKEVFGSFGKQVYMVNNKSQFKEILSKNTSSPLIFQEYIKTSKARDVRLQVVGDEVVASMYRYNDTGDFRANLSNGGKMQAYNPSKDQVDLAIRSCKLLGLDFAGVDLLFGEDEEPILCEVNSNAHFKNITDATGVNISDKIISHIKSQINLDL